MTEMATMYRYPLYICLFLCLFANAVMAGTVLDADTGLPIENALIHYEYTMHLPSPGGAVKAGSGGSRDAWTDARGKYNLGALPSRFPTIGFRIDGYIRAIKEGYFTAYVDSPGKNDTILLHKIKYKNQYSYFLESTQQLSDLSWVVGEKSEIEKIYFKILNCTTETVSDAGIYLKIPETRLTKMEGPFRAARLSGWAASNSKTWGVDHDIWYLRVFDEHRSEWIIFDMHGNIIDPKTLSGNYDFKQNFTNAEISADRSTLILWNRGVKVDSLPGSTSESKFVSITTQSRYAYFAVVKTEAQNKLYLIAPMFNKDYTTEIVPDVLIDDGFTHMVAYEGLPGRNLAFIYSNQKIVTCHLKNYMGGFSAAYDEPAATCKQIDLSDIVQAPIASVVYAFGSGKAIYITNGSDTVFRFNSDFTPDYRIVFN